MKFIFKNYVKKTAIALAASVALINFNLGCHKSGTHTQNRDKTPVIIDTDMGFDDWMAILYTLQRDDVEVLAIMVDCAGESYCPIGGLNATRLLVLAGKGYIPVFYGKQPKETLLTQFPETIRAGATVMEVEGFIDIDGNKSYDMEAVGVLVGMLTTAADDNRPVTLISIGTSTNIAEAITMARKMGIYNEFAAGVKRIYKGGGAFGCVKENGACIALNNRNIPGNLNIPGIYTSTNTTAEWNIFANAEATRILLTSGLPVTMVPVNLSDEVEITKSSWELLKNSAKTDLAKFVVSTIYGNVKVQGGWDKVELDYWDPSVVVAALSPDLVTKKFEQVEACVDTRPGNTHGATFVNEPAGKNGRCRSIGLNTGSIEVYTDINLEGFYGDFTSTLNGPNGSKASK